MRFLLNIEYDGRDYYGWQKQKNKVTISQTIEEAMEKILLEKIVLSGCGRTDAGVSALNQYAHFDSETKIPPEKLHLAINCHLPKEIRIKKCVKTDSSFHARYNAKKKIYVFKMYQNSIISPLLERTHVQLPIKIDFEKMQRATSDLIGTHDFKCFVASGSSVKNTVRTIYSASLTSIGDELIFEVCGNGFLYNMVRIICGTLYYIGIGKLSESAIKKAILEKDRLLAGVTLSGKGLYLKDVIY